MSILVDDQPWREITPVLAATKGRVVAAVAYIGVSGDEYLPLKDGDVLVCDADELTIRQGSTYVAPLRRLAHKGVELHSVIGLHAKVVVCPRTAFVGSANASDTSAIDKIEAVARVTASDDVRALRKFVLSHTSEATLLTVERLEALAQLQPRPRPHTSKRSAAPAELPRALDQIRLVRTEYVDFPAKVRKVETATRAAARRVARQHGPKSKLESLYWESWPTVARWREGEWLLEECDDDVASPAVIVSRIRIGDSGLVWLARPPTTLKNVPWSAVASELGKHGVAPYLRNRQIQGTAASNALLKLFR